MNIKIIKAVILAAGILLILGGIIGFVSIFIASKKYVHTVCIVEQYNSKKVYKSGKLRYKNTMLICYDTERYGKLYTTLKSYYPFRKAGDAGRHRPGDDIHIRESQRPLRNVRRRGISEASA